MKKAFMIVILIASLMTSCEDTTMSPCGSLGKKHRITQLGCDGKIIGQWVSTGNVSKEHGSDVWYFEDAKTGKLVELTGTIQIEVE